MKSMLVLRTKLLVLVIGSIDQTLSKKYPEGRWLLSAFSQLQDIFLYIEQFVFNFKFSLKSSMDLR